MSNFFRNIHPLLRRNKRPEKYDDTNFAVLNALNYELTQAEQETIASKIQSSLESATDTYLDTWGDWFGVYRKDGWDDEYYRARIIRELLLKRGTIPAIIDALVDFLNDNDAVIQIYEPWRNIFYTNKSKLNGDDHLMGYYYRFAIIDISIDRPFPPEIVEIIKAFKPAGVLFYLRLDTSLAKNKTTVESPYVYLDVTNKTELEFLNGLYYDLRGNINLSDQRTQVVGNNIFHTNNSKLNGEDVLAGAFNHGRGYIHLASTTLLDYTPKATDSMSNLKTTLGEAGSDMYNQTKEKDGRTASIQVPATKNVHTLYSNSVDFGEYDYSTAPNLLKTVTRNHWSNWTSSVSTPKNYVKVFDDYIIMDATDPSAVNVGRNVYIPNITRLTKGKQYTLSVSMMVDDEFDLSETSYNQSAIHYTIQSNGTPERPMIIRPNKTMVNQWQRVSVKFTVSTSINDGDYCFLHFYEGSGVTGKWYIRNDIMIQEGDQTSSQAPANQMPKITTDDYTFSQSNVTKTEEEGNITNFNNLPTSEPTRNIYVRNDYDTKKLIPLLSDKKQYTMSVEMWSEKEVTPSIRYRVNDSNNTPKFPLEIANKKIPAKQWTEVSVTKTLDLPSNPNILPYFKASDFKPTSGATVEDVGKGIQVTFSKTDGATFLECIPNLQGLKANTKYTMSADITVKEGYTGKLDNLRIYYRKFPGGTGIINMWATNAVVGQKTQIKVTENSSANTDPTVYDRMYLTIHTTSTEPFVGTVLIENLKLEEGETVTPDYPQHWLHIAIPKAYEGTIKIKNDSIKIQEGEKTTKPSWKPNLLAEPYEVGDVPVQPNIANKSVAFPINSSAFNIYNGDMEEELMIGQTYTITLKGTKPASQNFRAYNNSTVKFGELKPVEGLTDVWSLTFTPTKLDPDFPKNLRIYQFFKETLGACQIDWLKIEKGNTRTPNIDSYDYVGSLIEDTETPTLDPTKYTWTVNGDVTNKKAYMVFDIKTFIEENYATEFEKLVADLGEDQALNAVFENFNISTALKALVSPSSPINFSVELYDFSTSTWHKLNTDSLDLRMRTFNLVANRITDYLNDYKLLFVRYVFDNKTDKDVTVELDMLNVLFNYRLGDGYSLGLQSTVECLSEIPLSGITLSSDSVEVAIGETAKVTATPVPANATNKSLEWEIADPKIATVDTSGNITGVAIGETTLTVYGEDRTISATCSVSVKARHTLYSNSTDFGDYDYSGNPNLMASINADSFSQGTGALSVVDDGDEVVVTLDPNNKLEIFKAKSQPALVVGKTYTMSVEIMLEDDFTGDPSKLILRYIRMTNWVSELYTRNTLTDAKGVWQKLTGTFTITTASDKAEHWFIILQNKDVNNILSGKLRLRHAKVEEGSTATPYQPNLLDAPYYLSKTPLGENLVTNAKFPIITPNNPISGFDISEELIIGETYTVSVKGTKPGNKEFHLYYGDANYQQQQDQATLYPVEGLPNVWSATFTAKNTSETTNLLRVALWQKPYSATYDTVQIDWLKLEKGNTRTPNIDSYVYRGTVLTASEESPKDPNAYTWSSI
ncbi:hypothetical protein [Enterococcus phage phiSHEF16]|uniref:BIG2 domain-containing protein n=1 Tax=Enterococcus phage phiSHEF16 TaxID=2918650 RepID=A0AAE9FLY9_9CAUD|nr:hypothetical protein [Enterococcus phage phiSHEF16]